MSSNPLERLGRSFTFRLSLGYAALFTFSAVVLFGLLYLLLAATLQSKDREIIEARLRNARRSMTTAASPRCRILSSAAAIRARSNPFSSAWLDNRAVYCC